MDTVIDSQIIKSKFLKRNVVIDFYFPPMDVSQEEVELLLINDGQDLVTMGFYRILQKLYADGVLSPIWCVGIHCGPDRREEYGTTGVLDYKGRGKKAGAYQRFLMNELLPFIRNEFNMHTFKAKSICGFSLGGLSALDTAWNHQKEFKGVGVFSGSLWWRSVDQHDPAFSEERDRIIHNKIRRGHYAPWMQFFFSTGTLDETADRNNNGIIDSIDDTLDLIKELEKKGYDPEKDIKYLQIDDGRHDVATWARAFPAYLLWSFRQQQSANRGFAM